MDAVSIAGPSSVKRKPLTYDDAPQKKKRSRVSYSCSECHRRKQKCERKDKEGPCNHCIARKVPELCHAYQPGKSEGDLHARLSRVEQILELALPQFTGGVSPNGSVEPPAHLRSHFRRDRSPSSEQDDGSNREDELANSAGTIQESGRWFGPSAVGSINAGPILEQLHDANPHVPPVEAQSDEATAAAEKLKSLIQDYGLSPHKLTEIVQELPPRSLADVLIDHYFTSINWTRYPIYEPQFRAAYESIRANDIQVHPLDVRFLPLVFIILSTAARLAPENVIRDERQRRLTSLRYYWSSRRSMMLAAAVGEGLELVLARLLTARFLTLDRRISESWLILGNAVRTALALGLHRDGAKLGLDPFQTEYRRRIWAYLYHADRAHALVLGRPPSIQDEFCDTLPPTNVGDSILANPLSHDLSVPQSEGNPLQTPTPMTCVILRHSLAAIIGHIVRHFQQVKPTHYSNVLALDAELQQFIESLPPHYALRNTDTSLDSSLNFLPIHRFLIITEIFFVRISLHRPYMLRKLDTNRFAFSRQACFESARLDFEIRQAFKRTIKAEHLKWTGGGYREFQAAMISGISLVTDPHGPDAPIMHKILDTFLVDHMPFQDTDETTRREIKIIELLKSKSLSVAAGEPIHSPQRRPEQLSPPISGIRGHPQPNHSDASILLELGQPSRTGTPMHLNGHISGPASGTHSPVVGLSPSTSASPSWHPLRRSSLRTSGVPGQADINEDMTSVTSPSDGEESAQRMLDNWVHSAQDSVGSGTFSLNGMGLDAMGMNLGFGDSAISSWMTMEGNDVASGMPGLHGDDGPLGYPSTNGGPSGTGIDGSGDWIIWESLVDQIRASGPGMG